MSARPPGRLRYVASSISSTEVVRRVRSTLSTFPHEPKRSVTCFKCGACSRAERAPYPAAVAEYDLVCDACHEMVDPQLAIVSWTTDGSRESGFALTHTEHVPAAATDRAEVRLLVGPNEFLRFVTERFGRAIADPEPLRAIAWGLAPFVMRHDNGAEMDTLR